MVEEIFVGYCQQSKAYRVFNPKKREVNITHDVIFDEHLPDDKNITEPNQNTTSAKNQDQQKLNQARNGQNS